MAKWALKCVSPQEIAGLQPVQHGDTIAVVESNIEDCGSLGRMLLYGQLEPVRIAEDDECPDPCPGRDVKGVAREQSSQPQETSGDQEDASGEAADESDDTVDEETEADDSAESAENADSIDSLSLWGVDQGTIDALKDAEIRDFSTLVSRIESGEKISGIGPMRAKQLETALPSIKATIAE